MPYYHKLGRRHKQLHRYTSRANSQCVNDEASLSPARSAHSSHSRPLAHASQSCVTRHSLRLPPQPPSGFSPQSPSPCPRPHRRSAHATSMFGACGATHRDMCYAPMAQAPQPSHRPSLLTKAQLRLQLLLPLSQQPLTRAVAASSK